jgi:tyrosinase
MLEQARFSVRLAWMFCILLALAAGGCASVATRPSELLPIIELQINNTATQSDDYLGPPPATTPARARIVNIEYTVNFFGPIVVRGVNVDVPVEITNMDRNFGGQVSFGANCNSLAGSAFVTLPKDGSWVDLCLGTQTASTSDKDAVIQVRENRTDGVVLARVGVQTGGTGLSVPTASQIEMGFGFLLTVGSMDSYVSWVPRPAWIRRVDGTSPPMTVRLSNTFAPSTTRGRLILAPVQPNGAIPQPITMSTTLDLTLTGTETVTFWVAGEFGSPSTRDKDAVLQVNDLTGGNAVLGRAALMVRVRKDANTLQAHERDRFLRALVNLNGSTGTGTFTALGQNYFNYQDIHNQLGERGHSNFLQNAVYTPAFLPWHRLFILRLEREFQALDPSVALPYWQFSETDAARVPVNVFNTAFMGETIGGSLTATFDATNPLSAWATRWPSFTTSAVVTGVRRFPIFSPNQLATGTTCFPPAGESVVMNFGTSFVSALGGTTGFSRMEWRAHNAAHVTGGGVSPCMNTTQVSWLASLGQPIQDPLFFMLHSNVDRQWAKWQQQSNRFDALDNNTYQNQGTATTGQRVGQFLLDPLWPWVPDGPGGLFPQTIGQIWAPPAQVRILNAIDYQQEWNTDVNGAPQRGPTGLGYDYVDVPFSR